MYKILDEKVMLRLGGKWFVTTSVLTGVSGGKQVNYVDADGNILKSQAYSRSVYSRGVKPGDGFEEIPEVPDKPSFGDPDFMTKIVAYNKKLQELGIVEVTTDDFIQPTKTRVCVQGSSPKEV